MQQYNNFTSRIYKKTLLTKTLLISLFFLNLIIGCTTPRNNVDGITFVAPRGTPSVQSIVWSPKDENRIVATAYTVGQWPAEVYILDLGTVKKQVIAKTNYGWFHEVTWTPNGKDILLLVGDNTREFEPPGWWKVDIANNSSEYLKDLGYVVAAWSPDGKTIVAAGGEEIVLTNVSTKTVETFHTNVEPIYGFGLSWSTDSQYLVFPAGESPSRDLYVLNIKTQQIEKITENRLINEAVWSPKGNIIAFVNVSPVDGRTTLNLVSSDGTCEVEIPNLENVWSPTWSPDGRRLGYVGRDGIYFLEVDKVLGKDIYDKLCS